MPYLLIIFLLIIICIRIFKKRLPMLLPKLKNMLIQNKKRMTEFLNIIQVLLLIKISEMLLTVLGMSQTLQRLMLLQFIIQTLMPTKILEVKFRMLKTMQMKYLLNTMQTLMLMVYPLKSMLSQMMTMSLAQ